MSKNDRAHRMHLAALDIVLDNVTFPAKGCEVGVLRGELTSKLLAKFPELTMYMADPYLMDKGKRPHEVMMKIMSTAFTNTLPFANRRIMLVGTSTQVVHLIEDESLDFVYIDARHSRRAVKIDIGTWFPKVKKGGLVSGHDYSLTYNHGVKKSVDEFAAKNGYEVQVELTNWWFVK